MPVVIILCLIFVVFTPSSQANLAEFSLNDVSAKQVSSDKATVASASGKHVRAAVVYDRPNKFDHSFNQAVYENGVVPLRERAQLRDIMAIRDVAIRPL